MPRHLKTNEDLVVDLMNYSPYGALGQAFIIQAIEAYANRIIKDKEELLANDGNSIISNNAWIGIAEDVKRRMDEFYNRKS